jgi:D-alanyl-D-alanine carboxypeptidase/D-alanyl-D-alanine-endopeptidase (penicillin-binding protein 4)
MKIRLFIIFFIALGPIVYLKYGTASAVDNRGTMLQQLNELLAFDPVLEGAVAGVSVRSAETGELLYDHHGEIRLKPASNLKLLTAASALSSLGVNHQFETEILTDGEINNGILEGNLYLKGKGDPTLLKADLDKIARKLHESGLTIVRGNLIGDDTWYDNVRYSIDLPWSDETTYYGAQVSAITVSPDQDYDAGTIIVEVRPGSDAGNQPVVTLQPMTNYVNIINNAKTVGTNEEKEITITREHGKNSIVIEGEIPENGTLTKEWVAVWEPTGFALSLFQESLKDNGIKLLGALELGKTPEEAEQLTVYSSLPVSELLIPFMKFSNNGHGETLVKEMGKVVNGEGSWDAGLEVVKGELEKFGLHRDKLVLRDGSGISHVNLIPANQLSKLLFEIQDEKWFDIYLDALPIANVSERSLAGTLLNRMGFLPEGAVVRAKTGTITSVSSLSGYVYTKSGKIIVFSILLNNLIDETKGKELEDKIVTVLANQ